MRTAHLRRHDHAANGSPRHWGDPGDLKDEYIGSLATLVLGAHCRARGIGIEFAPLYVPNRLLHTLPPWDARIGDATIEIKGIPPDEQREDGRWVRRVNLLVKQAENHHSDYYVAVKFETMSRYWFAGYATLQEVLDAPVFSKFAPANRIPLLSLHPLANAGWLKGLPAAA